MPPCHCGESVSSAKLAKRSLRAHIKTIIGSYSPQQLQAYSRDLQQRLLTHPKVCEADTLLLYHSLPDEPSTHQLIDTLHRQGKTILLPKVISPTQMTLHPYHGASSLTPGAYGILEPNTPAIHLTHIPLTLIPGIAFDATGNRLGRGKGYYDRLLKTLTTYKLGICFPFQLLPTIPTGQYDVLMDEVIY